MRTYIGHNKCSRCGGGSGCYVCNDEPETKTTPMITSKTITPGLVGEIHKTLYTTEKRVWQLITEIDRADVSPEIAACRLNNLLCELYSEIGEAVDP